MTQDFEPMASPDERVAVVGLGYVGLPVALAFARHFADTIGFDIDSAKVAALRDGRDHTGETEASQLRASSIAFTDSADDLRDRTFIIVAVPTPIDRDNRPDLSALVAASETVGNILSPGCVVVYESTVYPGATEEVCLPALEAASGMVSGRDFTVGYSPERINPGDKEHTVDRIVKVVSAQDTVTLDRIAEVYARVIPAGIHRAPSIRVAETAKVIENTQRDLNVALMNELALICGRLEIRTADVLAAAGTKWNFLPFSPGLVGGHCIGVDPYYLTTKAEQLGYQPEVILAGRSINNRMGEHVATTFVKKLIKSDADVGNARVAVLGLTFKEDVPDLRNSRVPDIVRTLQDFGIEPLVHDPLASPQEARDEYGIELSGLEQMGDLDGLILAVSHQQYLDAPLARLVRMVRSGGVVVDVKSVIPTSSVPRDVTLWSL